MTRGLICLVVGALIGLLGVFLLAPPHATIVLIAGVVIFVVGVLLVLVALRKGDRDPIR